MSTIAQRVAELRRRMDEASARAGYPPAKLVAAAKTAPAQAVREAIRAGVDAVGENRVQEMREKDAQGAYEDTELHFIGHLQRNKVGQVVGRASLIHSVDSVPLAEAVDLCAERWALVQPVLLEINVAGEASKGGFAPDDIFRILDRLSALRNIRIRGLMAIPPPPSCEDSTQYFVVMHQLYIDIGRKNMDNIDMEFLSMGMSGDFEAAILSGANLVRIGSSLFGPRVF